jgi:hypothetical protein
VATPGWPVTSISVISRVAVVPTPPLLVPELAAGAAGETAEVRQACLAAVRAVTSEHPRWIAVGAGPGAAEFGTGARGSFRGYGVDVPVALSAESRNPEAELPLPALVAGWLREHAGASSVRVNLLDQTTPSADCASFGKRLDTEEDDLGLLILGDGSHRHGPRAPGGEDERATAFDDIVASALGTADVDALLSLDVTLAGELGAGGRVPWQVLAGLAGSARWNAELLYSAAPFGVGYHVALWERA